MSLMSERLQAAVADLGEKDVVYIEATLNLALGYLLGAGMYGCAAAVREVMRVAGYEPAGLFEALLNEAPEL